MPKGMGKHQITAAQMSKRSKKCPTCGGPMKEQDRFAGLWTCLAKPCKGMILTDKGARELHKELNRQYALRN